MRLSSTLKLLDNSRLVRDAELSGISYDSRRVTSGDAFIAVVGENYDGHNFINDAIKSGASAIIAQKQVETPEEIGLAYVHDTRRAMPYIAKAFYSDPMEQLLMVGITGTKGKTTTCHLVKSVLESCGEKVGLLGTVHNIVGDKVLPVTHTTPESVDVHRLLRDMVQEGSTAATMEVSSHALSLGRVDGIIFDVAVLTNIGRDHLDYHGTMDDYVEAKARLFSMLPLKKTKSRGFLGSAILNIDEPYVRTFADNTKNQVLYYGLSPRADVWARDLRMTSKGTDFVLVFKGEEAPVSIGIPGTFNVYNALAASAVALSLGFPLEKVMRGLVEAKRVKGRLEVLAKDTPYAVWVDYAHTPESLENVLNTARNMTSNRVISVFGCGGDRDPSKRPIMGGISAKLADLTIITSDNPRTENPSKILDQIERGIKELARPSYLRIEDRREAIKEAIKRALPGDIVVIAGKGHENYQVIGTTKTHFDDGEEASRAIEELEGI